MGQSESNIFRKFVNELSFEDKRTIILDYEQFENEGFIGDSRLRQAAREVSNRHGLNSVSIVSWMKMVAFECYRSFALDHINSAPLDK